MVIFISLKFLTLEWEISKTIWLIEVSDGSFCFAFFKLFHLSLTYFLTGLSLQESDIRLPPTLTFVAAKQLDAQNIPSQNTLHKLCEVREKICSTSEDVQYKRGTSSV